MTASMDVKAPRAFPDQAVHNTAHLAVHVLSRLPLGLQLHCTGIHGVILHMLALCCVKALRSRHCMSGCSVWVVSALSAAHCSPQLLRLQEFAGAAHEGDAHGLHHLHLLWRDVCIQVWQRFRLLLLFSCLRCRFRLFVLPRALVLRLLQQMQRQQMK